jgi:hypothetical protein
MEEEELRDALGARGVDTKGSMSFREENEGEFHQRGPFPVFQGTGTSQFRNSPSQYKFITVNGEYSVYISE